MSKKCIKGGIRLSLNRETIKKTLGQYVELEKEQLNELTGELLDSFHEELSNVKALTEAETKKLEAKEKELDEANKVIKNLNKNMKDPEEVAKQIEEYESTISGLREELHNQEISAYEQTQLTLAGAQDINICQLALDYDKTKIKSKDDYKLIDEAIENQKKNKAFLFKDSSAKEEVTSDKQAKYNPRVGNSRFEVKDSTGADFAKMLSKENQSFSIKGVNQ